MQNRKRDTDVQNRLLDSVGEGEGGMFQETFLLFDLNNCCVELDLYLVGYTQPFQPKPLLRQL